LCLFLILVAEAGDDISDCIDSECLVLVNHQSTGDVLVIMQALTADNRQQLSRHVCWILDNMFKYANFGLPCHVHGDFFILQVHIFPTVVFMSSVSLCSLSIWSNFICRKSLCYKFCSHAISSFSNLFVKQGRQTRNAQLARLADHIRNVYVKRDRTWIVLFPEGGFLCNRKESSQAYVVELTCVKFVVHFVGR